MGSHWRYSLLLLAATAAAFAAYQPALVSGFFWDDDVFITQNPQMSSATGLLQIWFQPSTSPHYYPLLLTVFWLLEKCFGSSASGYHFVNIALHVANAVLLFYLGRRLGLRYAWVAAFIFLLHPINVQSVAWITEMKNTLSTLFMLFGCLVWAGGKNDAAPGMVGARWWVVATLFAAAMLTKSTSIVMLLALVLIDWLLGRDLRTRRYWLGLLPLFATGLAFALFSASFERSLVRDGAFPPYSLPAQTGIAAWSVFFYLGKLIWPADLAPVYAMPRISLAWGLFWCGALIALFALSFFAARRSNRRAFAALLFFCAFIFPIPFIGVQFLRWYSPVTDHFAYVPSAVFGLAVAGCVALGAGNSLVRDRILSAFMVLVFAVFGLLTFQHAERWRTGSVWETAATNAPQSLAVLNYAGFLASNGRVQEALPLMRNIYAKFGDKGFVAQAYGSLLAAVGETAEAERVLRLGLQQNPGDAQLWRALGTLLVNTGRPAEAVDVIRKSLPANRDNLIAFVSALVRAGRLPEARAELPRLPAPSDANSDALADLARDLAAGDAFEEAEIILSRILRTFPLNHRVRMGLAYVLLDSGKIGEAHEQFAHISLYVPASASVLSGLAECLQLQGRSDKADALLGDALHRFPDPDIRNAYAWFLATCPDADWRDPAKAAETMQQIPETQRASVCYFLGTTAAILAAQGKYDEAAAVAESAIRLGEAVGDMSFVAATRERLELYRAGRPYVLSVPSAP
jgi:Flp pilus assembly protein TadD